ncbi:hypothetical protein [Corynebacterium sp. 13CS0277]|uniref:hypothetical protein n=1 Tax=Corynebacterium sp. 13CS0277 TaxID=2071994 RepID=UPI001304882C|nr:hypothetical protein [Corynebacterium sp. 13CS0277]
MHTSDTADPCAESAHPTDVDTAADTSGSTDIADTSDTSDTADTPDAAAENPHTPTEEPRPSGLVMATVRARRYLATPACIAAVVLAFPLYLLVLGPGGDLSVMGIPGMSVGLMSAVVAGGVLAGRTRATKMLVLLAAVIAAVVLQLVVGQVFSPIDVALSPEALSSSGTEFAVALLLAALPVRPVVLAIAAASCAGLLVRDIPFAEASEQRLRLPGEPLDEATVQILESQGYQVQARPPRARLQYSVARAGWPPVVTAVMSVLLLSVVLLAGSFVAAVGFVWMTPPVVSALVATGALVLCGRCGYRSMTVLTALGGLPLLLQQAIVVSDPVGPSFYLPILLDGLFAACFFLGLMGLHILFWSDRLAPPTRADALEANDDEIADDAVAAPPVVPGAGVVEYRVWNPAGEQHAPWTKAFFRHGVQVPTAVAAFASVLSFPLAGLWVVVMLPWPLLTPVLAGVVFVAGWRLWSAGRKALWQAVVSGVLLWVLAAVIRRSSLDFSSMNNDALVAITMLGSEALATLSVGLTIAAGVQLWQKSRLPEWARVEGQVRVVQDAPAADLPGEDSNPERDDAEPTDDEGTPAAGTPTAAAPTTGDANTEDETVDGARDVDADTDDTVDAEGDVAAGAGAEEPAPVDTPASGEDGATEVPVTVASAPTAPAGGAPAGARPYPQALRVKYRKKRQRRLR